MAAADAGGKRGAEVAAGLLQREYILPCGLLQREQQRDHGDQLQHRAGEFSNLDIDNHNHNHISRIYFTQTPN